METVRLPARFFALVAALTVLVAVGVGSRADAVHASTPPAQIYFTFVNALETDCGNPMAPPLAESQFNIIPINGQVPATVVACVWAKGVKTGIGGAAGFNIDMTYNNNIAAVASFVPDDTWLESTGRSLTCPAPSIGPAPGAPPGVYRLVAQCVSFGQSPPGPTGGGLLGVLTLAPNQTGLYGISNLDHTNSFLVRVTSSTDVKIATTATDGRLLIARCADVPVAGNPPDGSVAVTDVVQEVQKFGWTSQNPNWIAWMQANPQYQSFPYDLDFSNAITVSDIAISVSQFGRSCPT